MIRTQNVSAAVLEGQETSPLNVMGAAAQVLESFLEEGRQTQPKIHTLNVMVLGDMSDAPVADPNNVHDLVSMVLYHDPIPADNRIQEMQAFVLYDGYGRPKPPKVQTLTVAILQAMMDPVLAPDPGAMLNTRIY